MEIRFATLAREGSECKQRRAMFEKNSLYAVSFAENHSFSDRAIMGVVTEDGAMVNVEETVDMLPKSRKALTIQEIAALARSSLYGISQVVKDHVTKPTAMAQGRVAHLIEWKGWCRPCDSPAALESHFSSYSHLTEGEQEARFAAGVAEQFAIAEAKLRAWSSVDGEDSCEESGDEDAAPDSDPNLTTPSGDSSLFPQFTQDLWQGQVFQPEAPRPAEDSPAPPSDAPATICSRVHGQEDRAAPESALGPPPSLCPREGEDPSEAGDGAPCCPGRGIGQDSAHNPPRCLSRLNAEDELERDVPPASPAHLEVWGEPSSGAMSLEEEEEEEEEEDDEEESREEDHQ